MTDATDEPLAASPDRALRRRARLVVVLVAVWLWALALGLPAVEIGLGGWARAALALAFPLSVATGLALDAWALVDTGPGSTPLAARASLSALLVLAPAVLVGAVASRVELSAREVMGPAHLALLVLASASYLAAVAFLGASRAERRTARSQPLPPSSMAVERAWPRWLRRSLVGAAVLAGIGLVAIAPTWTGHASRVARHGLAGADTAALLATVVGLALAVTVLGAVVAPAMRAPSAASTVPSRWRGVGWIGLALASVFVWWLLERA